DTIELDAVLTEKTRLLALDQGLRAEAGRVLSTSGLGEIVLGEGYEAVGSYVMRTMTWRDLDFERAEEEPDWERHWALGTRLARLGWVWKLHCTDAYRQPDGTDEGLYWGLMLCDPAGGPAWKVDLWTARAEEFAKGSPNRARWAGLLTEETRFHILAIKESVCHLPEYRREMLSVHVYEAVLDDGVRSVADFMRWWQRREGKTGATRPDLMEARVKIKEEFA
ncbi:MAG: hypothetical protein NTU83_03565, partial [Candidatus Hydrogenedentes bacterium]|nr:hypothetical protein [Candidatus Hydrogenedentota bacterium]